MGWQQEHACKRAACCVVDLDARDVHVHVSCTHVFICWESSDTIILETPFQLKERVKCDGSHGKKKQDHLSAEIKSSNIGAHTPRVVIP
jgi:hypothetical protein